MNQTSDPIRRLAHLIEEISGNVVPDGHLPFLQEIAEERRRSAHVPDLEQYVRRLAAGSLGEEWARLLSRITVNESYFFRAPAQFRAFASTVVPNLVARRKVTHRLTVWSAGCARGEEPATIAMVLAESEALRGWDWRIVATDVDEAALADAREGRHAERAVQNVPAELRQRYLVAGPDGLTLAPTLQARIDYRVLNLVREPYQRPAEPYDVIFLRNVLIYFRPDSQRRVVANMAASLAPDGYLFVGASETLWQLTAALVPQDLGGCFCYRFSAAAGADSPLTRHRTGQGRTDHRASGPPAQTPPRAPTTGSAPTPPPAAPRRPPAASDRTRPGEPEQPLLDRLQGVVRHLGAGRLDLAEQDFSRLQTSQAVEPAFHALAGLLHDLSGRWEQAAAAYRAALFLDPDLFQARLLLADVLRRLGWTARARHEYKEVLSTLSTPRARALGFPELDLPDAGLAEQRCRAALSGA